MLRRECKGFLVNVNKFLKKPKRNAGGAGRKKLQRYLIRPSGSRRFKKRRPGSGTSLLFF